MKHHANRLLAAGVAAVLAVGPLAEDPSAAAGPVTAPQALRVHFQKNLAHVDWGAVAGAVKYYVQIDKIGYDCPCVGYLTKSTSINIAYSSFPYKEQPGSYRVQVTAYGAKGRTAKSSARFKTKVAGDPVPVSKPKKASSKVNACLREGEAAGLTTAVGGGLLVAVTSWVPGVDAVTAGSVASAAASATAGRFVYCMIPWPW